MSETEVEDSAVEQDGASDLHDQATALLSEVRELRKGYEQLVAHIDAALAAGHADEVAGAETSQQEEGASGLEVFALNLALSGYSREEALASFAEQFGEVDEELIDKAFGSAPTSEAPPRRGPFRRRK